MGRIFCVILLIKVGRHVRVRQCVRQPTYAKESRKQISRSEPVSNLRTGLDHGSLMAEVFVDTVGGTYIYLATFSNANANVLAHITSWYYFVEFGRAYSAQECKFNLLCLW